MREKIRMRNKQQSTRSSKAERNTVQVPELTYESSQNKRGDPGNMSVQTHVYGLAIHRCAFVCSKLTLLYTVSLNLPLEGLFVQ